MSSYPSQIRSVYLQIYHGSLSHEPDELCDQPTRLRDALRHPTADREGGLNTLEHNTQDSIILNFTLSTSNYTQLTKVQIFIAVKSNWFAELFNSI